MIDAKTKCFKFVYEQISDNLCSTCDSNLDE